MGSAEVRTARKRMQISKICPRLASFGLVLPRLALFGLIWPHVAYPDLICQLPLNQKHNSLKS